MASKKKTAAPRKARTKKEEAAKENTGAQTGRKIESSEDEEPNGELPPPPTNDGTYQRIPALAAYIERIGAVEHNFRRYIVREHRGGSHYYVEKSIVKINNDGTIYCSRKEYEPTEAEAKAIQEAFVKLDVPKSIGAKLPVAQAYANSLKGQSFLFHKRKDGLVHMIQERWIKPDGSKVYIPWSFWSDGKWRRMEPDGDLPFWKPVVDRKKGRKMIHEGAKAAFIIDRLVNDPDYADELAAHPWCDVIKQYEHWGMIGGALAPHRADYAELKAEKPTETVYACDRDYAGESALQEVSKHCGLSLKGIMYGDSFPEGWDMGDPIPETLYKGKGERRRYIGRGLRDLMSPATRATEVVANPSGKGRGIAVLTRRFREEWLHAIRPEVFVHRDWPHEMWIAPEFNSKVRPFSDVDDTARLLKADAASKSAILKYDPSEKAGVYGSGDEGRYINTHRPSQIEAEKGDVGPFIDYMEHLVPGEKDRHELMRWCATLIARPDIRMKYAVVLISEMQGVGKSTLGEKILAPLVGATNVSYPSEQEIVESNFNYWLAHKRLAVVHEIYAGHSSRAYNKLKSVIADKNITVQKKYMSDYQIENWMHIYACSNSKRAIQLTGDDRRWFVPRVTEEKKPADYWLAFNRWLDEEGGLGIIKYWAKEFLKTTEPVGGSEEAPWSSLKEEVVEEGYSPGQALVSRTLDRVKSILESDEEEDVAIRKRWEENEMLRDGKVIMVDLQFTKLITDVIYQGRHSDRLEKAMTIRKVAKNKKWLIGSGVISTGMNAWGSGLQTGRLITNSQTLAETSPADIGGKRVEESKRMRPLDLNFMKEV